MTISGNDEPIDKNSSWDYVFEWNTQIGIKNIIDCQ